MNPRTWRQYRQPIAPFVLPIFCSVPDSEVCYEHRTEKSPKSTYDNDPAVVAISAFRYFVTCFAVHDPTFASDTLAVEVILLNTLLRKTRNSVLSTKQK